MIPDSEVLMGIATLGLTLTGFSGLVAIMGQRNSGQWSEGERVQFVELAVVSLTATFGAFIPILVASVVSDDLALQVSLAIVTVAHIGCITHGLLALKNTPDARREYAPGVVRFIVVVGLVIIGASLAASIGIIPGAEPLLLSNLVWLLFVAVVNFVQLLTGSRYQDE